MYASFRSVTAKNGKILTPTRTGNFLLTSMDREFYAMSAEALRKSAREFVRHIDKIEMGLFYFIISQFFFLIYRTSNSNLV